MNSPEHSSETAMKFRRIGGSSQLVIESPDDFRHACELDPAHWTLTSIPAKNTRTYGFAIYDFPWCGFIVGIDRSFLNCCFRIYA